MLINIKTTQLYIIYSQISNFLSATFVQCRLYIKGLWLKVYATSRRNRLGAGHLYATFLMLRTSWCQLLKETTWHQRS